MSANIHSAERQLSDKIAEPLPCSYASVFSVAATPFEMVLTLGAPVAGVPAEAPVDGPELAISWNSSVILPHSAARMLRDALTEQLKRFEFGSDRA